ncbi:hypothetical protein KQR54_18225 [Mycobacterium gordonae]|nr:hypothetical protein [Mycobacterium gordonae]
MSYFPPAPNETYRIRVFNFDTWEFFPGSVTLGPPTYSLVYYKSHRTGLYVLTLASPELRTPRQEHAVSPVLFRSIVAGSDIAGRVNVPAPQLRRLGFDPERKEDAT